MERRTRPAWNPAPMLRRYNCHRVGVLHGVCATQLSDGMFEQGKHEPCRTRNQGCKWREAVFPRYIRVCDPARERCGVDAVAINFDFVIAFLPDHLGINAVA